MKRVLLVLIPALFLMASCSETPEQKVAAEICTCVGEDADKVFGKIATAMEEDEKALATNAELLKEMGTAMESMEKCDSDDMNKKFAELLGYSEEDLKDEAKEKEMEDKITDAVIAGKCKGLAAFSKMAKEKQAEAEK